MRATCSPDAVRSTPHITQPPLHALVGSGCARLTPDRGAGPGAEAAPAAHRLDGGAGRQHSMFDGMDNIDGMDADGYGNVEPHLEFTANLVTRARASPRWEERAEAG